MCNPYTYLSVPVWRTYYNTCVLWSAIYNMKQWNYKRLQKQEIYVYKKQKKANEEKKTTTQRAWIFAAPWMGFLILKLCIYGVPEGGYTKANISIRVRESLCGFSGSKTTRPRRRWLTRRRKDRGCFVTAQCQEKPLLRTRGLRGKRRRPQGKTQQPPTSSDGSLWKSTPHQSQAAEDMLKVHYTLNGAAIL